MIQPGIARLSILQAKAATLTAALTNSLLCPSSCAVFAPLPEPLNLVCSAILSIALTYALQLSLVDFQTRAINGLWAPLWAPRFSQLSNFS